MNNNEDSNSPVITVTNSLLFKVPPSHLHRQHSYLKVRYLALAFETLHYPWIPS